jgi:hypothetical protein
MIKLKNILEIIQLIRRSKQKSYILLTSTTNPAKADLKEYADFKEANKKAIELMRSGDTTTIRVVLVITTMELKSEIKK